MDLVDNIQLQKLYRSEYNKLYYAENKKQINEYNKLYYAENKKQINEWRTQKITCICGSIISRINKSIHLRSNKHKKYLQSI